MIDFNKLIKYVEEKTPEMKELAKQSIFSDEKIPEISKWVYTLRQLFVEADIDKDIRKSFAKFSENIIRDLGEIIGVAEALLPIVKDKLKKK